MKRETIPITRTPKHYAPVAGAFAGNRLGLAALTGAVSVGAERMEKQRAHYKLRNLLTP